MFTLIISSTKLGINLKSLSKYTFKIGVSCTLTTIPRLGTIYYVVLRFFGRLRLYELFIQRVGSWKPKICDHHRVVTRDKHRWRRNSSCTSTEMDHCKNELLAGWCWGAYAVLDDSDNVASRTVGPGWWHVADLLIHVSIHFGWFGLFERLTRGPRQSRTPLWYVFILLPSVFW